MTKIMNFSDSANDSLQNSASANEKGIQIFNNQEFGNVRTALLNGEVVFAATDVAKCLGYANPQKAIRDHCKEKGVNEIDTPTNGGIQKMKYITKGNVIRLVANSTLPQAEKVESWIFDEVIPQVLEHGGYMLSKENETPEELMARALMIAQETLKRKEQRLLEAEAKIKADAPKVEFYDAVTDSKDAIDMRVVATTLNMGVGRNKIFDILRKENILDRKNIPYQRYIDNGYFRTVETSYSKPDGTQCINIKTVVFQKGLDFIRKIVENNIRKR